MKLTFGFDAQFVGKFEKNIELSDDIQDDEIKNIFKNIMGLNFDDNCYIIKDGILQE